MSLVAWFVLFMAPILLIAISGRMQQGKALPPELAGLPARLDAMATELQTVKEQAEQNKGAPGKTSATWKTRWVNWMPWKLMEKYTLADFSRILCGIDPNGTGNNESGAFLDLLRQEADSKKLTAHLEYDSYIDRYLPASWNIEVDRITAIKWAKAKGIDVSHIE